MDLYLVQHGEAAAEEVDPARPLTEQGRAQVARVARAARRMGVSVTRIHHSGKLRAHQTAEVLARELGLGSGVSKVDGLAPNDDPTTARRLVETLEAPVMLVGHLPHLSRLTSLLVAGDASREIVAFRMGGIVCLARGGDGTWRVRWALPPEACV